MQRERERERERERRGGGGEQTDRQTDSRVEIFGINASRLKRTQRQEAADPAGHLTQS